MRSFEVKSIVAGDMSASINGIGTDVSQAFCLSVQGVFTGSPVGSLKLQVSNDVVPVSCGNGIDPAALVVNWSDYDSAFSVTTAGNKMWNLADPGFRWIRPVYVKSSGSGTLDVVLNAKGV